MRYLTEVRLKREAIQHDWWQHYPFSIPAIRNLDTLPLDENVTFLVGENGSGKSTLLEGIAGRLGFNAEGGSRNFNFCTRASHSQLHRFLNIPKVAYPKDGYFLRAESFYNVATEIENLDRPSVASVRSEIPALIKSYGGTSLHEQSHGESFFALLQNRLSGNGIFMFDEPESALSPSRQLTMLSLIHKLVRNRSQLIIATHSPILMAYPHATIYRCSASGIDQVDYKETEHYQITRDFLTHPKRMLDILLE